MENVKVKIVNKSKHELPAYQTLFSAGMDICANLESTVTLGPLERKLIPTGLYVQLPEGYELQVRPRSGLTLKQGITVLNTPGTVDADYRGEIGIILINLTGGHVYINDGDRIAQMVVTRYSTVEWDVVDKLDDSERGSGGFGHTGV